MLMLYQHSWTHFAHDTIPFILSYFVEITLSYVFYKLCIASLEPSILLPAFFTPTYLLETPLSNTMFSLRLSIIYSAYIESPASICTVFWFTMYQL